MAGLEKSVLATSLRCIMVENRVDRGLIHRDRPRLIRKSFDKGVPCPVGGEGRVVVITGRALSSHWKQ